jgi:hypothetical protein
MQERTKIGAAKKQGGRKRKYRQVAEQRVNNNIRL